MVKMDDGSNSSVLVLPHIVPAPDSRYLMIRDYSHSCSPSEYYMQLPKV